jgi:hypothetical protein
MNVDAEFFRIVEELGPLGAFESHPSTSRRLPQEIAGSRVTHCNSGEAPKWDRSAGDAALE